MQENLDLAVDLDDQDIWTQYLYDRVEFFKRSILIVLENLYIVQDCDILRYVRTCSEAYCPRL